MTFEEFYSEASDYTWIEAEIDLFGVTMKSKHMASYWNECEHELGTRTVLSLRVDDSTLTVSLL